MDQLNRQNNKKTVVVTGCSSGLGRETAHVLRERGWTVIATARKDADIEKLRSDGFAAVRLDLGSSSSIAEAVCEIVSKAGRNQLFSSSLQQHPIRIKGSQ